ncbi:hypothetical protein H4R33_003831 [Dimargaris cristalligena]|nr:hypothetical protein H4R33_003831 [Dimargaris cristalligena]
MRRAYVERALVWLVVACLAIAPTVAEDPKGTLKTPSQTTAEPYQVGADSSADLSVRVITFIETKTFTHLALVTQTVVGQATGVPLSDNHHRYDNGKSPPAAPYPEHSEPPGTQRPSSWGEWVWSLWPVRLVRWFFRTAWSLVPWFLLRPIGSVITGSLSFMGNSLWGLARAVVWVPLACLLGLLLALTPVLGFLTISTIAGILLGGLVAWSSNLLHPKSSLPLASGQSDEYQGFPKFESNYQQCLLTDHKTANGRGTLPDNPPMARSLQDVLPKPTIPLFPIPPISPLKPAPNDVEMSTLPKSPVKVSDLRYRSPHKRLSTNELNSD